MVGEVKIKNTFYSLLILIFTLSSLFKTDYKTLISVDFGGYSSETEISLVIKPKVYPSTSIVRSLYNSYKSTYNISKSVKKTEMHRFLKIKLNKYVFTHFIPLQYLNPDHVQSVRLFHKFNICHQSLEKDPFIS